MTTPPLINGWTVLAHPYFLSQFKDFLADFEESRQKYPIDYKKKAAYKLLAALQKVAFTDIPQNPTDSNYRQGDTLGKNYKSWFRAKFGNGRYRLFFRYNLEQRIIILAWVNDEDTLRTRGSKTDAYHVFSKMLDNGNPPNNWNDLLKDAKADINTFRDLLKKIEE